MDLEEARARRAAAARVADAEQDNRARRRASDARLRRAIRRAADDDGEAGEAQLKVVEQART
jgi:hypothetical protein